MKKNPRLLLFWQPKLRRYTYLGTKPEILKSEKPLSSSEYRSRSKFDFTEEARHAISRIGYRGKLVQKGDIKVVDELKDKENVGMDQFAFLEVFNLDKPVKPDVAQKIAENYTKAHPDEPPPLLLTEAEISERSDIYHRIIEDAKERKLLKTEE